MDILKGCFLCTDSDVLYDPDIDRHNEISSVYHKLCLKLVRKKLNNKMRETRKNYRHLMDCDLSKNP